VAAQVGREESVLANAAPLEELALKQYYKRALAQSLKGPSREGRLSHDTAQHQRLVGFLSLAFYIGHSHEEAPIELRNMCLANQITPEQGATVFSLLRELIAWEPASDEDLTHLVTADRSIIRSSRVTAESADPELFIRWLEEYSERLSEGKDLLDHATTLLQSLLDEQLSDDKLATVRNEFTVIIRSALRDYGIQEGRAKLTELREQLGVARNRLEEQRLSRPALSYSQDVVLLAGHYAKLSLEERRAFKMLMQRVDTHAQGKLSQQK